MPRAFAARLAVLGGIALAPSVGFAQMQHDGNPHSGTPPAALGEVHFPVTCSAEAQAAFDGGMRLQHSFWYQAAGKEFREVRRHDPGCTMAHWGEALSMLTNPYSPPTQANLRQGRVLLEEARASAHAASARAPTSRRCQSCSPATIWRSTAPALGPIGRRWKV